MKIASNLYTGFKWVWILAVVMFIGKYFSNNYSKLINIFQVLPAVNIILSMLFLVLGKIFLARNMSLTLNHVSVNWTFYKCFRIYNVTQLAKYIPGGIWQFVGRVGYYAREGINKRNIRDSILIENIFILLGASTVGIICVSLTNFQTVTLFYRDYGNYIQKSMIFIMVLTIFVAGYLLAFRYASITEYVKKIKLNSRINIKLIYTQLLIWAFLGLSFFFTAEPYFDHASPVVFVIGLYALAYIAGYMVPFAPAGIGIREGVLVLGLSIYLSPEISILLASINRILYILIEILLVLTLMIRDKWERPASLHFMNLMG